jgi:integrase
MVSPLDWTREMAAECVAEISRMKVGEWINVAEIQGPKRGLALQPRTRGSLLAAMSAFFQDGQEWGWFPRRFDARRCFALPRAIKALIGPQPRVIQDDVWAKLVWAGLNLTAEDLPQTGAPYPIEMVRAMAVTWLFAGLRSDEFRRLRRGCVRWQQADVSITETKETLVKEAVCWLDIPVNKTSTAFTKAVDRVVGEAIEAWEQERPIQPAHLDPKTGEVVDYLFQFRGQQVGKRYLNVRLIPYLCRKAGVPEADARGNITSHRARSTIATQLYNAKEPLTLFELQAWLGHHSPATTQHYAKITPTKLAKAYEKAGYFGRNIRTIEVLIDQDAIKSGAASKGEPWRFFDLGHGYCLYEFFDACPHRMACAHCSFYQPKGSTQAQLLEGKTNLLHMLQEIPLNEEERAAVEDGIEAMEKLCQQLADVPTPAGPTPQQLSTKRQETKAIIPLEVVRRTR